MTSETPVVVREAGYIDIRSMASLIPIPWGDEGEGAKVTAPGGDLEVWDGKQFVRCTARTAYWHEGESMVVHGRGGVVECTPDHVVFTPDAEVPAQELGEGDRVLLSEQPQPTLLTTLTEDEAWLLGILTAEGYVSEEGKVRVTCNDDAVLAEAAACWERVSAGTSRKHAGVGSAFSDKRTAAVDLTGNRSYGRMLRAELYDAQRHKRVPKRILNASPHLQETYLRAYNLGDGLRAGHGTDELKSFRTTSDVLAAGLIWLARTALGRGVSVYRQPGALGGGDSYLINLSSGSVLGNKGAHLRKPQDEVRKIDRKPFRGWMCDLATDTERFAAGPGLVVVHNSPRRGLEFVTRKISHGVARIKLGMDTELALGNLESQRDWGYAGDYVEAMWMMLQRDDPDDFVIGTGETHSVREFCQLAFDHVGLDYEDHVTLDERFVRPAEVDLLVADPTKANTVLGWRPKVDLAELVAMMVDADLDLIQGKLRPIS